MPLERITQRDFRSVTSRAGGDRVAEGIATAGGSTTLTDTVNLIFQATDDIKGTWAYIYEGPGGGTIPDDERYVSASTTGGRITVAAWDATPTTASRYEIHRRWRVEQWNDALAVALRDNRHALKTPMRDDSLVGVGSQREYTFPEDVHSIHMIEWVPGGSASGLGIEIPPWEWEGHMDNRGIPGMLLRFSGSEVPGDGSKIIVHGQKFASIPLVDSDVIEVPTTPLRYHVLSQFYLARGMENQGLINKSLSDEAMDKLSVNYPENTRIIQAT